jgi:hypothetical protein
MQQYHMLTTTDRFPILMEVPATVFEKKGEKIRQGALQSKDWPV